MKLPILFFLTCAGVLNALSCFTVGSEKTVQVSFLPETMTLVPQTYFFGTIAAIFCVLGLVLISRGWERDSLPSRFIAVTKGVVLAELSLALLPTMIFIGVLVQEIRT